MSVLYRSLACAMLAFALASHCSAADDSYWKKDPSTWQVELRPVQLWVPSMSSKVTFPDLPNGPSGTATSSVDSAYSGGFRLEKNKWAIDGNFLWAELSADNDNPNLEIKTGIKLGQLMVGREILPGLSLEGGFRGMSLDLAAQFLDNPELGGEAVLWDPLIGMTYRKPLGKKWRLNLHGDGGGFGAGSDVTYSFNAILDWRFAKHFGTSFGYNVLHFETSNTFSRRTLITEPTIYGPMLGFGIYF